MQSEDLDAINRYMVAQQTNNTKAASIRDDFIRWYSGLSWVALNVFDGTLDEARNRRNQFNEANAEGDAEYLNVKLVEQRGLTSEEMQGLPKRELSSGRFEVRKSFFQSYGLYGGLAVFFMGAGYVVHRKLSRFI